MRRCLDEMGGCLSKTGLLPTSAVKPEIPKALTSPAKRIHTKLQVVFLNINQGLIGWGTLTFRKVKLHGRS